MPVNPPKKVPRFFGLRIYLASIGLYAWLVLPFILLLGVKYSPVLKQEPALSSAIREEIIAREKAQGTEELPDYNDLIARARAGDTLAGDRGGPVIVPPPAMEADTTRPAAGGTGPEEQTIGHTIAREVNLLFNLTIICFFAGFLFNIPFKRYFSRKRRGKKVSEKLYAFTKRFLLISPLINTGILGVAFLTTHIHMIYILFMGNTLTDPLELAYYEHFFYISMIASALSLLFVYYWEKHRVHIRYIEHIFPPEELRRRIFKIKVGKIRSRMFLSSAMTTLLPLTIVILYLVLSVTYIKDIDYDRYSPDVKEILFGDMNMISMFFYDSDQGLNIPGRLFYINVLNSMFMFFGIVGSIIIVFVYILFLVKWTTQDIVQPVKELLENMRRTGQGELEHFTIVRTNDEIGELSEGYNDMTQKIGDYIHNISRMTDAYSRFVPRQFLDFLGKESFVDIRLGDQVEKEMTVMFSDIRHFTDISEQMTPKENFDFLNYYLGYMEPVIRNNNGFIDKYIGDSIMALFHDSAEDAINASIEMRIKLSQFNQVMDQFDKPTINSGIGIHSGSLMLGVVGGEGRMDGTVISDAVNLAARLEGLTKLYGSSIIISQDTLIRLNNPSQYNYRFLDIVKVKGKKEAVYIFEIIDGDPEDIRQLKIKTKHAFADGINFYKSGKFREAMLAFADVYALNHHDVTANLYISRCKRFLDHGIPEDWDGIERIGWN